MANKKREGGKETAAQLKGQCRQFIMLWKHFLWRLLDNDMVKFDSGQRVTVFSLAAILMVTGGYISYKILSPFISGAMLPGDIWLAKAHLFAMTMALTGIVSVMIWDRIFLDCRDIQNIWPLPVKLRILVLAKLLSVFAVVGLIVFIFGLPSVLIFTYYAAGSTAAPALAFALYQFVSLFAASLSVFLLLAFLQSLLRSLSNRRFIAGVTVLLQAVLLGGFISIFFWFPLLNESLPQLKESFSRGALLLPPLWFVGLNETLAGSADVLFNAQFYISLIDLSVPLAIYLISFYVGYHRAIYTGAAGRKDQKKRLAGARQFLTKTFNAHYLRDPVERAIFYFVLKAFRRNRQYKIHLAALMVLPLGFLVTRLVYLYSDKMYSLLHTFNADILSIPLILGFFLAVGLRTMVLHSDTLEANWIFKVTEITERRLSIVNGLKKALILLTLVPTFTLFFLFHLHYWGIVPAFMHSLYGFSLTLLLLELFFLNYNRVPFASTYSSDKFSLKLWWPVCAGVFLAYVIGFVRLEILLMDRPLWFIGFYGLMFLLVAVLRRFRHSFRRDGAFSYEEEPILGLGLPD